MADRSFSPGDRVRKTVGWKFEGIVCDRDIPGVVEVEADNGAKLIFSAELIEKDDTRPEGECSLLQTQRSAGSPGNLY